ncbi:unnamed protein product [Sphenostylis stenocarpa]|uniref:Uncharacterized protein n=1 Tax=Sphenostylis stenocarpa TaxID=92480 RepID=A0AA86RWF8_9FABA|nr:unnamed protein product [Sphenostylis stenocarpa]
MSLPLDVVIVSSCQTRSDVLNPNLMTYLDTTKFYRLEKLVTGGLENDNTTETRRVVRTDISPPTLPRVTLTLICSSSLPSKRTYDTLFTSARGSNILLNKHRFTLFGRESAKVLTLFTLFLLQLLTLLSLSVQLHTQTHFLRDSEGFRCS